MKKWITYFDGKVLTKQTECGIRGIFIGFANNQKGNLVYLPSTRQIAISADVLFDESFQTAIVTNWHQHQDSLASQPVLSFIPNINTTLESTGSIKDHPQPVEEGE